MKKGGANLANRQTYRAKPPRRWVYRAAMMAARPTLKLFLGLEIDNQATQGMEGPAVVVANHQGMLDFILTAVAFPQWEISFVAFMQYFERRWLRWLLNWMGAIPKRQFYPDLGAVKSIIARIRQGGVVGIFPAGQTSMCGVPGPVGDGIGRLCRKLKAPVVCVHLDGAFFSMSRLCGFRVCRGLCRVSTSLLLTPEQLAQMTDDEAAQAIRQAIDYDEYAWAEKTRPHYKGKRAAGYENLCWRCPKCGAEFSFRSRGSRLFCENCGNEALVDPTMLLRPARPDCQVFSTLRDWYAWQRRLLEQADGPDFVMSEPVELRLGARRGRGMMTLTRREIRYDGFLEGLPFSVSVENRLLPGLLASSRGYFEIYNASHGAMRFYPADGRRVAKWKQCQEYLYQTSEDRAEAE